MMEETHSKTPSKLSGNSQSLNPKPYDLLEPAQDSSSGLSASKRREIFLNKNALAQNVDVKKNEDFFGCDLSLIEFPEWQRTKHVHRLHPYLGKFIPQLVEIFLRRFFKSGDLIVDPFAGSGTTLVEANILGIHSIGIELSPFNALIQKVKTQNYDLVLLEQEVKSALDRVSEESKLFSNKQKFFWNDHPTIESNNEFLNSWYAPQALKELLFYQGIIPEYKNSQVLKIILSRAARSCRLIPHYDLARPKKPLSPGEQYFCRKHKRMCQPIGEALKFIRRYSKDTVKRIKDFSVIRTDAKIEIIEGDSREVSLSKGTLLDGLFTSPPYVGMIDYHEQHRYSYELFSEFRREDLREIGRMSQGKSVKAKTNYSEQIATTLQCLAPYLKKNAKIFLVANDSASLYPNIIKSAGLRLINTFHRPVPMRTERDTSTYFESIFWAESK